MRINNPRWYLGRYIFLEKENDSIDFKFDGGSSNSVLLLEREQCLGLGDLALELALNEDVKMLIFLSTNRSYFRFQSNQLKPADGVFGNQKVVDDDNIYFFISGDISSLIKSSSTSRFKLLVIFKKNPKLLEVFNDVNIMLP